ncbi:MAG: hypothetical protein IJQ86_07460 [Spirochaetia bacterium]|nr:hypothetical protein [Spirochaetia bacterium]
MKSKFYILASILAVLCLICSCGGGGGSDSASADVVQVRFGVDSADGAFKSATATNPDLTTDLVYEYKATAAWDSDDFGTPKGDTNGAWVEFTPYVDAQNPGTAIYFAQGKWTIQVQVKKNRTVIYTTKTTGEGYAPIANNSPIGQKTQYINSTTNNIEIEVEKSYTASAAGSIVIQNLYAPDTSGADKLVVTYGPVGGAQSGTETILASEDAVAGTGDWAGYNKYNYTISGVAAGAYWVTVAYNNGTSVVGASTVASEIIAGLGSTITGSIENGVWTSQSIAVVGVKQIEADVRYVSSSDSLTISKAATDTITITASATITDLNTGAVDAGTKNYTLYVDGTPTPNTTGSFTFAAAAYAPGTYSIYCIAADSTNKIVATATPVLNVIVNP